MDSYDEISFLGKICCFLSKTKMNILNILFFATHGLMTIFNKSFKFRTIRSKKHKTPPKISIP